MIVSEFLVSSLSDFQISYSFDMMMMLLIIIYDDEFLIFLKLNLKLDTFTFLQAYDLIFEITIWLQKLYSFNISSIFILITQSKWPFSSVNEHFIFYFLYRCQTLWVIIFQLLKRIIRIHKIPYLSLFQKLLRC